MHRLNIRSSAVRFGIFASALVIAVILVFQLLWLDKVYRFEQKQFDISVLKSVRGLYEDLEINLYNTSNLSQLIERPAKQLYLARISLPVNDDSLVSYLQYELEDFDIFTNCSVAIYSATNNQFIFTNTLYSAANSDRVHNSVALLKRNYNYIALYFPNRQRYIFYEMNFWIVSTLVLVLMLIISAASLYFFYRQRSLNEIQKDFVENFTHEFKTPVATIALAAETLENKNMADKPGKLAVYAGILKYQAAYLQKQIERLLQFSYIDSGRLHLEKKTTDMHLLVKEAVMNLEPLVREKNAELQFKFNAPQSVFTADRDYLVIMITNLVENAIKFSKHPVVTISTMNKPGYFVLTVADNGPGISKKQIKKLFVKFYRVRNNEEYSAKGFGIGLSFVKKIIQAHKGKITVESSPGTGTTFIAALPVS